MVRSFRGDSSRGDRADPGPSAPFGLLLGAWLGLLLVGAGFRAAAQTRPAPSLAPPSTGDASRYEVYETPAFTRAVRRGTRSRDGRPGPRYWQQYARYQIRARLDTSAHRIIGRERVTYLNRSPDTLDQLAVHLRQNLFRGASARRRSVPETGGVTLRRVAVQQTRLSPTTDTSAVGYRVEGTVAWLRLPTPLPPDDSLSLQFRWAYTPPPAPADGRQGRDGRVYYAGYWYPQIAVYDDVRGWVAEPYTGQAEFYMGQADYDVRLTVPAHWRVGATGQLRNAPAVLSDRARRRLRRARRTGEVVSLLGRGERGTGRATRAPDGSTATWHFTAKSVRDFAWGTSDRYLWDATRALVPTSRTRPPDTVMIHSLYRPRAAAAAWPHAARYTAEAVATLSETLRPYPYPTMTSMEGILRGGGMEYPMITIMQPWADTLKLAGDLMHEVGHMWIPMEVGTNEKRHVWMDEGLTQFNTAQGMRSLYGPGPRPSGRASDSETGQRRTYLQIARRGNEVPLMRHGDDIPASLYFDLPYDKAAQVLTALRGVLGPTTFRRAYDAFFDRWWGKHPTPHDFFNTIADVAGRDLSWFWTTWFYRTPTLDQALPSVRTGADSTTITIENRGRAPMPVPLVIRRADGSTSRRTVPVDVWLGGETRHQITIPADPPVVRVEIDPERHFPDLDRSNQTWRRGR
ncbi:MAG: M1 family metallopeptidase [Salinibacter sp.]